MKKNLPKSFGFTLIELMVVISIIAVLSLVGFVSYTTVQKNARDATRKIDIDAIANALEANKTAVAYVKPADSFFASGKIPFDPKAANISDRPVGCGNSSLSDGFGNACWYCIRVNNTQTYCQAGDHRIDDPAPGGEWGDLHGHTTSWNICANLESTNPNYYCRRSSQ